MSTTELAGLRCQSVSFLFNLELAWGLPALALTFLICSLSARALSACTRLRPTWTALAAFGVALGIGLLYLRLFSVSLEAPRRVAIAADVCLILLMLLTRARSLFR